MPYPSGGGGGFALGPDQNVFTGANRTAAELLRMYNAQDRWLGALLHCNKEL